MGIDLTNEQVYCIYSLENWWNSRDKQVFEISGAAGTGKALTNNTFVPTTKGEVKIKDIKVGDFVFNRHGKPVEVLGVYPQGKLKAYRVRFDDGSFIDCNDNHIWTYMKDVMPFGHMLESKTLKEIKDDIDKFKSTHDEDYTDGYRIFNDEITFRFKIPLCEPVEYSAKDFSNIDFEYKKPFEIGRFIGNHLNVTDYGINAIPDIYLRGSIKQRISLLKGISLNALFLDDIFGCITFPGKNHNLLLSIKYLLSSLGIKSIIVPYTNCEPYKNADKDQWFLQVMCKKKDLNKFTDSKRQINWALEGKFINNDFLGITSIEEIGEEEMTCIYVNDKEHLFLCGPFIPTHNTTIVKYFIERLGLSYDNVLFMAYAGKAATQLARNGIPAKTIHSSIYNYEEKIVKDEKGHIIFDDSGKVKLTKEFVLKPKLGKKIKLIVIDEASMVNESIAKDILSFNIPIVTLGDLNQLPPVFGNPFFLVKPDIVLHQIMRQAEGSPIIYLSQKVLNDEQLRFGVYGNSFVIPKSDISEFHFKKADIVITGTNRLRYNINNYYREEIKKIKQLDYPHINEKIICCKNNWDMCIGDNLYLTNGTTGFVDYVYKDSYNKRTMKLDFRPDYSKKIFRKVEFDYNHMYAKPGVEESSGNYYYDKFEFAYAVTCHKVQGSQYPYVLYMHEDFMRNNEDKKKMLYTAITRATETIGIVL